MQTGLTPLVGREPKNWGCCSGAGSRPKRAQAKWCCSAASRGLANPAWCRSSKSRSAHEGATRIEFRCSPYHQNSAFYPIIDHLQRLLQFAREDAPARQAGETPAHAAATIASPRPIRCRCWPPCCRCRIPKAIRRITVSPQKQKEKTQEALVAWLVEEAEKAAVYCAWEDLHWADPSTLEVLTLFLDQVPTTRLLALLTFRPEFTPPWGNRSHLSQLTLSRLGRPQVEAMVEQVTGGKALPAEVVQQIVSQDRWRAVVCRRVDQDGGGVGVAHGRRWPL